MKKHLNLMLFFVLFLVSEAHASKSIAQFTGPIEAVVGTVTGPVGRLLAIFAMAACGVMYIWQKEDMTGGMKMLLSVAFAISFIAFAAGIVDALFSFSGALA